jgi:hypothetical protein
LRAKIYSAIATPLDDASAEEILYNRLKEYLLKKKAKAGWFFAPQGGKTTPRPPDLLRSTLIEFFSPHFPGG